MQTLIINRPDDWHLHLRDGEFLTHTVQASAQHFARALVMPNLKPALTNLPAIESYRNRIISAIPKQNSFIPYMTFYLNESVKPEELQQAASFSYIVGAKLYPAGATTNSEEGAKSLKALYPLFETLQTSNLVLQIHGEVTHSDIFEREALFIDEYLKPIARHFPKLRIVLEHISTKAAVDYVSEGPANLTATITPHHLLYNRNKLLAGGIRPHYYCLPILKHEKDQKALQIAATSGNPKFFAGTDSAPHAINAKENACGCAGIYSAPFAVALYTQIFDELNQLKKLNDFLSRFGAEFYQLPINQQQLELIKSPQTIPNSMPFGSTHVVPIAAGDTINWSINGFSQ
ncbi:TPA: dihydroorotase [Legionella pneumophila]|uniref:dihydroorotase n=1 Tax=Legionella pneumophila TaxID=446 RepID=UPI000481DC28|nr:dihydroorotase [Legionella pneumophila]MCZ4700769.1 dihydroorotase [Legionella pneumophila]MCZ4731806.1 dihydroorotase [Legionella pneumophila]MCZ4752750.1 dihydroorotase [Legionella pneumophila]MDW9050153.1 dihydroorotase [Legionella pneumophila]MDW9059065.1 dihydroorotase [Legionella pneumophila]